MKLLKSLIILIACVAMVSCEQEPFTGTGLEALEDFELSLSEDSLILRSIYPNEQIQVSWEEAESGLNSAVNYTWLAFDEASSAESPLLSISSDEEGSANTITFTADELDETLESLGISLGEFKELTWTVSATNGDVTTMAEPSTIVVKRFEEEIAPFSLINPTNEALVELDIDNPSTTITIDWDSTYTGFGNTVNYKWLAILPDGSFDDPLLEIASNNEGGDHQLTLTHQTIDDILANQGLLEGEYLNLNWKVLAESSTLSMYSNETYAITFRRFNSVKSKYLVGAATPGGWGWDNPTEIIEIEEGVFQGTLVFSNEAFRIFDVRDDWGSGTNFPYYENEGFVIDDRFENALDGDQNFRFIGEPGEYTFTLDLNNQMIYLDGRDSKFMVGAATPGGWSWDNPTEMIQVKQGIWYARLAFNNDSFRFFDIEGDWGSGSNYPFYEGEGYTIDVNFENALDGDQNFRFVGTPGEYLITLDTVNKSIVLE